MANQIEGYLGITAQRKKSKLPAKLDLAQSITGLILGLFLFVHTFFVSAILISKDFMHEIVVFLEAGFVFEGGNPIVTFLITLAIFVVFIAHALLGMRKLPINFKQFLVIKQHSYNMKHTDTTLWFVQAITGFALFFLVSIHLYVILANITQLDPNSISDRVWSGNMWPLYLLLIFAAQFHAIIGLYRLCVKWGWFMGKDPKVGRARLAMIRNILIVCFIILELTTLATDMKHGYENVQNDTVGQKYVPTENN